MPTPDQLAVDLHDLWFTANSCRDMAGAHTSASSAVSGCSPASAFTRPDGIGYGATGIYDEWAALREQIVTMLTTNASSLRDTATAMDTCVEIYTNEDDAVKAAFDKRKAEIPYE
jgi:hypothetical protein